MLPADPPTWPLLRAPDQKQPARPSSSRATAATAATQQLTSPFPPFPSSLSRPAGLLPSSARELPALIMPSERYCPVCVSRVRLECAVERNPINPRLPAREQVRGWETRGRALRGEFPPRDWHFQVLESGAGGGWDRGLTPAGNYILFARPSISTLQ